MCGTTCLMHCTRYCKDSDVRALIPSPPPPSPCPLFQALKKKARAESELTKVNALLQPSAAPEDVETITEEEKYMFRRLGQRMKAYLEMGTYW